MKKILYISLALLITLVGGTFAVIQNAKAVAFSEVASVIDITSPSDSLTRTFVFYPGTPFCPEYQIEADGINPNIPPQNVGLGQSFVQYSHQRRYYRGGSN